MKKKVAVTLLFFCFPLLFFGQAAIIDSLENLLRRHVHQDTTRINLLNQLSYELRRTDYVKGYHYALEADSLSDLLSFRKGKAESLRMIARYFRSEGDYTKALEYVQHALKINEETGYKPGIAYCLGDMSAVYLFQNNYALAIEHAREALRIAEEINDLYQMPLYLNNLGVISERMGDHPGAVEYYRKGLKIAEKINDRYSINAFLGNIGIIYADQGNYPLALENYQRSLHLCEESNDERGICYASANIGEVYSKQGNDDKALEYYKKALEVAEKIGDKYMELSCISLIGNIFIKQRNYALALTYLHKGLSGSEETGTQSITSQILLEIGTVYQEQYDYTRALDYYRKALKISEDIGEKKNISEIYMNIGSVYYKLKSYPSALDYSNKSLLIAEDLKLLDNQSKIMLLLADIYAATGNYKKAYQSHKTYKQLNDSVFNAESLKKITGLEYTYKYEKEKQAAELEQQKKDEVEAQKLRRQKIIAWSAGLVILLMGLIAFLLYRNNRQQKKAFTVLKETQSQLIHSEKMASLGELTAGIAHEIQNPLNFVTNFSEVSNQLVDEMKEELETGNTGNAVAIAEEIRQNLGKINQHGRRADSIVKGMLQHSWAGTGRKEPTDINALTEEFLRLTWHGFKAKDDTLNIRIETDYDETIATGKGKIPVVAQEIGRVIRNLLSNAFYAVDEKIKEQPEGYEPTVSISTKRMGDKVEIKVKDNGNGIPKKIIKKVFQPFTTTKPSGQGTGLGLSLSYDIIVHQHNGQITFNTEEGKFTEFVIHLPVK